MKGRALGRSYTRRELSTGLQLDLAGANRSHVTNLPQFPPLATPRSPHPFRVLGVSPYGLLHVSTSEELQLLKLENGRLRVAAALVSGLANGGPGFQSEMK
jgi:hypothetical protein